MIPTDFRKLTMYFIDKGAASVFWFSMMGLPRFFRKRQGMNRNRCAVLSALLSAASSGAFADPITVAAGAPGVLAPEYAGATVINLDVLATGALPFYFLDSGGPNGAVTLTGAGAVENANLPGVAARPAGTTGNYLTVSETTAEGAVSLTFSVAENYFGLYWGSLDPYNSITFLNEGQVIATYTGAEIATLTGMIANGNQMIASSNGYINFYTGDNFFDEAILSTTNFGFEVANIAYGDPPVSDAVVVPEPSSLVLLGSAFSSLVVIRRRRRRNAALAG
jgi:hypothetical protein